MPPSLVVVFANPIQQAGDGGFDILARGFEVFFGAVVGVCDLCAFRGIGIEAAHQADLVRVDAQIDERIIVSGIHRDEEIGVHVLFAQFGCAVGGAIVSGAAQLRHGPLIRALPHVPAAEPAGIHGGEEIEHVIFHFIAHDDFSHGRAANIAGTHKDEVETRVRRRFSHAKTLCADSTVVRETGYSTSVIYKNRA